MKKYAKYSCPNHPAVGVTFDITGETKPVFLIDGVDTNPANNPGITCILCNSQLVESIETVED